MRRRHPGEIKQGMEMEKPAGITRGGLLSGREKGYRKLMSDSWFTMLVT
jgi:hypothetical protein